MDTNTKRVPITVTASMFTELEILGKATGLGRSGVARIMIIDGAAKIKREGLDISEIEEELAEEWERETKFTIDVYLPRGVWFFLKMLSDAYLIPMSWLCAILIKRGLKLARSGELKLSIDVAQEILKLFETDEKAAEMYEKMHGGASRVGGG